jgi:glycosyltransferase involved in cell wall biosynthesis
MQQAVSASHQVKPQSRQVQPRVCIVGPLLGRNPGWVTTQGEKLEDLLRQRGHKVVATSSVAHRLLRPLDMAATLVRRRRDFDLALIQVYSGRSFASWDLTSWIARRLGCPVILVLRGGALPAFGQRFPSWCRRVLARADALVAPTRYLARWAEQQGFAVQVIPNVIDVHAYPFRLRSAIGPRLLWMRTFEPNYHPEMAVRVLAALRAGPAPDATLVMGGSKMAAADSLRALARELQVEHALELVGFLDMAGKAREFARADVFLNTNRVDNTPVSVVEALAAGLPVVATRVGGIPDLLSHEHSALLVDDGAVDDMAAAVQRLLTTPELVERLSTNGREIAETCHQDAVGPAWEEVFARVWPAAAQP